MIPNGVVLGIPRRGCATSMGKVRVKIVGRNAMDLLPLVAETGLEADEERPEVVVSYGGDGTLLRAEREWPGVPKVALRDSKRCRTCSHHSNKAILEHLAENRLKRTEFIKLHTQVGDTSFTSMNDVIVRNAQITSGVRYRLWIDDEPYGSEEIVGDGLVVATPFGSTAYYRSITHSTFRVGVGLAFNNCTEPIDHLVLSEDSVVRLKITRGPATLSGDNNPTQLSLDVGDEAVIRRADHNAVVLAFDKIRYPADQFLF